MRKPELSLWQIWNLSFGFMGIQFGWGLQMANMSAIYTYLGAKESELALLWLAAPITGLLVQPVIGYASDRTWGRFGRRKPYFFVGALLASLALLAMPHSSALWMAAGLLWILDTSVNISMEPFRAFVADMLPEKQLGRGFTMQAILIGIGAVVASAMPWLLTHIFKVSDHAGGGSLPSAIYYSFIIGSAVLFIAVLYTILSTKEYPPENESKTEDGEGGCLKVISEIFHQIFHMPLMMRRLAAVQFFSWFALFCLWVYFSVAVASDIFGGMPDGEGEKKILYDHGVAWGGMCFSVYNFVALLVSLAFMPLLRHVSPKRIHITCLLIGAAAFASILFIDNQYWLIASMIGVGIMWASILAMPYALLTPHLPPENTGFYMGVFNFFIVLPQITVAIIMGSVLKHFFNDDSIWAFACGACSLVIAALLMLRVKGKGVNNES